MTIRPSPEEFSRISGGYSESPDSSFSLKADAYTDPRWAEIERAAIFRKTWQWVCHAEKLRKPGAYLTIDIAGHPICIVRDPEGPLRAFYNVCKHRAHELLQGEGTANKIYSCLLSSVGGRMDVL